MNFLYLALIYLLLDFLWIGSMTPLLYRQVFETIQGSPLRFKIQYAVLAYVVLVGVLYYVCRPLSRSHKYKSTPWLAYALVGFALYSVYNLTNAAVLTKYSTRMIMVDTVWGTSAFALLGWLDANLR